MTTPLYSGEAICKRWGDSSSGGRTVTLQLEADGEHPFRGYEGERFAVVFVPIGNDEKPMKKKLMGDAPTREDGDGPRSGGVLSTATSTSPAKPKKRWPDMPASQRAALLVKDQEFRQFLDTWTMVEIYDEETADKYLKSVCGVDSKASLMPGTIAYERFIELEGNFQAWRQAKQLGAA